MSKFNNFHTEKLRISELRIAPAAQRVLDPLRVNNIAAHFIMGKMRQVVVSHRDGHYYTVDGQHAVAAAAKVLPEGNSYLVECRVHEGLTLSEEAELFLALNNQKAVNRNRVYAVGVTQGHGPAFEVNQVLSGLGLAAGPGGIIAVGALMKVHKDYGPLFLRELLSLILEAFDESDDRFAGDLMKGLARFLAKYRTKIVFARLIKVLRQTTAADIIRDSARIAVKNKSTAIVSVIIGHYDYRRPADSRLLHADT